jgi:hypothetical protein
MRACLAAAVLTAVWLSLVAPATTQGTLEVSNDAALACVPGEVLTYSVATTVYHTRASHIRASLTVADIGSLPSSAAALPAHVAYRTRQLFAASPNTTVCIRVYYLHDLHVAYPDAGLSPAFDNPEALPVVIGPSPHTYVADLPLGVGWTDPLKHSPIDPTTYTRPTHLAANSCMYRLLK